MNIYDSLVIGAGPAGLSASLYLARFGLKTMMVEKLTPGGMLLQTNNIENYPGFPDGIKGYELTDAMIAQIKPYGVEQISGDIVKIEADGPVKKVLVDDTWLQAKSLIICSGGTYRTLQLPNENKYTGKGLCYCAVCDGHFFKNQPIAVVGGGNTALEEALYLSNLVSDLYLVHRRDEFRGASIYQERIKEKKNIHILYDSVLSELHGEDGLSAVTVKNVKTGEEKQLNVNGLFVFIGFNPSQNGLPANVQVDNNGFILTDVEMKTNIPGVFAAGDIRSKQCRQIATAVGDGVTAANSAYLFLGQ